MNIILFFASAFVAMLFFFQALEKHLDISNVVPAVFSALISYFFLQRNNKQLAKETRKKEEMKEIQILHQNHINDLVENMLQNYTKFLPIPIEIQIVSFRDKKFKYVCLNDKIENLKRNLYRSQFSDLEISNSLKEIIETHLVSCKHGNMWANKYSELCDKCMQLIIVKEHATQEKIKQEELRKAYFEEKKQEETKYWNLLVQKYGSEIAKYIKPRHSLSLEELGKRYERYIGYLYEINDYKVEYHGITKGKKDRGIDIIAKYKKGINIIQCKRWGQDKLIRENAITQLIGTFEVFKKENPSLLIEAYLYSQNDNLDERARQTLSVMGIKHVIEPYPFDKNREYPLIKCNIGKDGEKIYHLPTDGSYDRIKIEISHGEFYSFTSDEAEAKGFRRTKN